MPVIYQICKSSFSGREFFSYNTYVFLGDINKELALQKIGKHPNGRGIRFDVSDENHLGQLIDAADIANPTIGWGLSMQEVAPYLYVSGVRQPVQYSPTSVNKKSWATLPDDLKLIVEQLNKAQPMREYGRYLVTDAASTQLFAEYGCEVIPLSPEIEMAFEEAAIEFYNGKAAADPFYAEVYNSILAFKSEMRQAFPRL